MAGVFARRILRHRAAMRRFRALAAKRHLRAARIGRRALRAKARGRHLLAARLLRRAFAVKAAAARAQLRARIHHRAIGRVRIARRLWVQRHAGR